MKTILFTILATTIFINSYSQKFGDSKIVITLSDTLQIYEKVKFAFEKSGFVLNDDNNKDSLTTKPKSIYNPFGFAFLNAIITGNIITFTGWYKQMPIGEIYENKEDPNTKSYKRIIFFNNSSTWRVMNKVAQELEKRRGQQKKYSAYYIKKIKRS